MLENEPIIDNRSVEEKLNEARALSDKSFSDAVSFASNEIYISLTPEQRSAVEENAISHNLKVSPENLREILARVRYQKLDEIINPLSKKLEEEIERRYRDKFSLDMDRQLKVLQEENLKQAEKKEALLGERRKKVEDFVKSEFESKGVVISEIVRGESVGGWHDSDKVEPSSDVVVNPEFTARCRQLMKPGALEDAIAQDAWTRWDKAKSLGVPLPPPKVPRPSKNI
ncbi:MAG: hypothetical protein COV91_01815 [Candidatus Taylorbacteria bacterium CG11_big_fil_rev_8_21_14_0_20_46_11]|uniref:Uncharacterized protein n=1 Tax=Candidatus Taylorbacteria bacterium CG11_big_fil_rev_8_21_14_0_20_46_11 TaxID=1975025 RepID=A0A2H0KCC0_9BACT|nr:MAG: hypothetical protein COV91_01815 [Candidatus Taylorbacteria bacterium CG11_big_fil_rev_8_21_14_0_20_46_11]